MPKHTKTVKQLMDDHVQEEFSSTLDQALEECPGAKNQLITKRGHAGAPFLSKKETVALNVSKWRQDMGLSPNSVREGFIQVLMDVRKNYPECQSPNTALNLRLYDRMNSYQNNF